MIEILTKEIANLFGQKIRYTVLNKYCIFQDQTQVSTFICNQQFLLYLLVSTRAAIGQINGPYSPVRPAEI